MDDVVETPVDLVARIMAGDRGAEAELVDRYRRGLRFFLRHRTQHRELAEDLLQDTFLLVIVKIRDGQLREPERISGFIYNVARNLLIEHFRKKIRRRTDLDPQVSERIAEPADGPFELVERDQLRSSLDQVIDELTVERDRLLLRRYFFDDADKDELCRELAVSSTHFDRVKYRAIHRLADLLRPLRDAFC